MFTAAVRKPVAVIDTSSVIALDAIDAWSELTVLFDRLLLPDGVRTELQRRRAMKDRLRKVFDEYSYVEWCTDYDRTAADILRPERKVRRNKDKGEAETIVQASTRGAIVIVDDRWGRKQAELYRLDYWGTLRILERFYELGLRTGARIRSDLLTLKQRRIRLPTRAIRTLLNEMGEQPLPET